MRTITAAELTRWLTQLGSPARLIGDPQVRVGPDVVIDSRQVRPGALFVALPGEHADGHDYVAAAAEGGATAALVTHEVPGIPAQILVDDAGQGLSDLARGVHRQARAAGLDTVAVTGSVGKTSTKDLIHQVLARAGQTVSPVGSFNNEIGTPLTVCRVDENTRFLVAEMGARARGDVAHLCSIAHPDVALVCNVGTAHIGEFGSQAAIAEAKGEIYEALDADGWAVFNLNDPWVAPMWQRTAAHRAGYRVGAGDRFPVPDLELRVTADRVVLDELQRPGFELLVERGDQQACTHVQLQVIGAHQVANATAAATVALCLGVDLATVADALTTAVPRSPMRMELHELAGGAVVINDAYNANPDSMAAGLRTLADMIVARRRRAPGARAIAVLGDMLELGATSAELHRRVGQVAAELGIDQVVAVGDHAADICAGAGRIACVAAVDEAAGSLELNGGDVVLVKASRGLRLERIVDALISREDPR